MDAKERARRFKEHQELVSKVVKQQENIKKKRRQKLTGEEAYSFTPHWNVLTLHSTHLVLKGFPFL